MSRITRVLTLVVVAAGSVLLPATVALAQVPRPLPASDAGNGGLTTPLTPVTVVTSGNSGLATWAVLLIAAAAVVVGVVAAASYQVVRSHHKTGALATA
jgi:hypothetical protein